jgi:hypothetical protein
MLTEKKTDRNISRHTESGSPSLFCSNVDYGGSLLHNVNGRNYFGIVMSCHCHFQPCLILTAWPFTWLRSTVWLLAVLGNVRLGLNWLTVKYMNLLQSLSTFCKILSNITARNRTARIRHWCRKTTVLSCQRCLINTGIEKVNNI